MNNKNPAVKQKAVFLDRDGTINKLDKFVKTPQDFELIDGVAGAIKKINHLGFLAIVITNQPVIARGEVTPQTLEQIHAKMEADLEKHGAYLDDVFYCPHDSTTDCDCKKPKPGMILQAAKKYNIDLTASWMIGDNVRDTDAGNAASCKTALITPQAADADAEAPVYCASLKEFTERYLK